MKSIANESTVLYDKAGEGADILLSVVAQKHSDAGNTSAISG